MMMSRITIDLKKRANSDNVHFGRSTDPMVVDGDGPYRSSYQLSHIQFRDPREYTQRGNPGDSDTVVDIDGTAPVSPSRGVSIDGTLKPTRDSGGDWGSRVSYPPSESSARIASRRALN